MTRSEVLRKCITVFEAIRRMASKGNAGLEPERGAEDEYSTVDECIRIMKEWMQEMEAGPMIRMEMPQATDSWDYLMQGGPLVTTETLEALRKMDEARERMIGKTVQPEPNVPVIDMREWQRIAAQKPPERLDFDEDPLE